MKRYFILLMALVCATSASPPQARADANQSQTAPKKNTGSNLMDVPKAIAGFCTGFAVGIPICFARKLCQETVAGAHGMVGSVVDDSKHKFLLIPAGLMWLPAAAIITSLEAPAYAFKDAYMADKPFSKEQFSLGELDAQVPQPAKSDSPQANSSMPNSSDKK